MSLRDEVNLMQALGGNSQEPHQRTNFCNRRAYQEPVVQ
jgi:hypothetical protein